MPCASTVTRRIASTIAGESVLPPVCATGTVGTSKASFRIGYEARERTGGIETGNRDIMGAKPIICRLDVIAEPFGVAYGAKSEITGWDRDFGFRIVRSTMTPISRMMMMMMNLLLLPV